MGAKKPNLVLRLLEDEGLDGVVLSDTDVVWLRRPHSIFAQHQQADVLISTDCLSYKASPCLSRNKGQEEYPLLAQRHGTRCRSTADDNISLLLVIL